MAADQTRKAQIQYVQVSEHEATIRTRDLVNVVKVVLNRASQHGRKPEKVESDGGYCARSHAQKRNENCSTCY